MFFLQERHSNNTHASFSWPKQHSTKHTENTSQFTLIIYHLFTKEVVTRQSSPLSSFSHLSDFSSFSAYYVSFQRKLVVISPPSPPHLIVCVLIKRFSLPISLFRLLSLRKVRVKSLVTISAISVWPYNFYPVDTDSLVPGLQGCNRLETLKVEGNPVYEDPKCGCVRSGYEVCQTKLL